MAELKEISPNAPAGEKLMNWDCPLHSMILTSGNVRF